MNGGNVEADVRNCEVFYVLDFDRCLGDTSRFHAVLEESIHKLTGVSPGEIAAARRESMEKGRVFDTVAYVFGILERTKRHVSWEALRQDMLERADKRDMLEPGAKRLLDRLDKKGLSFGILTHGKEEWQQAKLEAAKLDKIPHIITGVRQKAILLRTWRRIDGSFRIPSELTAGDEVLVAKRLVFIDDKAISFYGLPPGVEGYHIAWSGRERLPEQMGEVPVSVKTVGNLDEIEI